MKTKILLAAAFLVLATPSAGQAQATTRPCGTEEGAGAACLLSHKELPDLPAGEIYWHLDRFPSKEMAERAATATGAVVEAFGSYWLFTIADVNWRARWGDHVAKIGPLPIAPASSYAAEYLRSVFTPGMTAPLHVHSGPEAFYAISGDTCLETPDGAQIGRGPGNSQMIRAGAPMLLMAVGKSPRNGFALILHDRGLPPTTLTQVWQPSGLCAGKLLEDRAR
ncbi:hypothetical protein HL653_22010 [Sphingomonas sp. AP4-R1]|uniref:hypothetical protein n=1 Tax=Sphingomonas sp. AP4-R1 TaxID=2735134 RepID=UPI0014933AF0|nr:hypothetical protein [Sphingomonas sp. AP4-R1]QJU60052.1 hypothetical protein HL653_22010 [Sphingomonas sp. AP4-R1]